MADIKSTFKDLNGFYSMHSIQCTKRASEWLSLLAVGQYIKALTKVIYIIDTVLNFIQVTEGLRPELSIHLTF